MARTRESGRPTTPARPARTRWPDRSQQCGAFQRAVTPRTELVVVAECLLPPEDGEAAEKAQRDLSVEPTFGVDATALERGAEGSDGVFLRLWRPRAVDREVPREV